MRGEGRWAFRRTAKVGLGCAAFAVLTFALTSPGRAATTQDAPATAFGPGTGSAIALVYKVNPIFGNLSFGITVGESVAGHQNTGAQAQSKAVNLGVIGVTLAGEGCKGADPTLPSDKQPQPVLASSDDPAAAKGVKGSLGGAISMFAKASTQPLANATTELGPLGDATGLLISGGRSDATSGVLKPGVREARAVTDIAKISLFGGLITLNGLHWEAVQTTGGTTTNSGTFTLGSINLLGSLIPLPRDGLDQVATLNDVLNSLGLTITLPKTRVEQGIVFVDPLKIGIVPSLARDNIIATLLGRLQGARELLVDALNQLGCNGAVNVAGNNISTLITVLDLALADVSGAGSLTVELGGVQATTAEIAGFTGLGQLPSVPDLGGTGGTDLPDLGSGTDGTDLGSIPVDVGGTGGTAPDGTGTGTATGSGTGATKPVADVHGKRGGALATVGGVGLVLLLATAEGDRRKMRRAQREIPLEA